MKINEQNVRAALWLAQSRHWENGLPVVRAKVRLVINSIKSQNGGKVPSDAETLTLLIRKKSNSGIRKILKETDLQAFAFALRDAFN